VIRNLVGRKSNVELCISVIDMSSFVAAIIMCVVKLIISCY